MTGKASRSGSPTPSVELADRLRRAEEALGKNDLAAADAQMAAAAELCRRLQEAGLGVPAEEVAALKAVAERCGQALARVGKALNAESQRDENHRRGISSYLATLGR